MESGHHVLQDRHAGEKLRGLEGASQAHAGDLVGLHTRDRPIPETNFARIGPVEAADDVEKRRLAGAVGPNNADNLADVEGGRDASSACTPPNEIDTLSTARMVMSALPALSAGGRAVEHRARSGRFALVWSARCSGSSHPGSQRFRNTTSPFGWNTMKPTSSAPKTISWVDLNSRRGSMIRPGATRPAPSRRPTRGRRPRSSPSE